MPFDKSSITDLICQAKEQARREIGDVPPPRREDPKWPIVCEVGQGLAGAVAAESKIGVVDGERGQLVYRGYEIFDLAAYSTFEEVAYLLIFGKLPTSGELQEFTKALRECQQVLPATRRILMALPVEALHPMTLLEAGVLGAHAEDAIAGKNEDGGFSLHSCYRLIAQLMTVTGMVARLRQGKPIIEPDPSLSHAANVIYTMTGERPSEAMARIMDVSLILHADHGMNASTFTSMVVTSTLSDAYFAVSAGLGSLKGPLHGGANEAVVNDLEEIGNVQNVEGWFQRARESKRKIMGMGHREYKAYDPRARVLKPLAKLVADTQPENQQLFATAEKLETTALDVLGREKKIFPNVDFYSGLVYKAMGIETAMFTPLFAVARVAGWIARCLEYRQNNRIFRPGEYYTGDIDKDYVAISQRG